MRRWWGGKWVGPRRKTVRRFLKQLETETPYDLAILLVGISPKEKENTNLKRYMHPCVYCGIVYSSQGVSNSSVRRQMNGWNIIQPEKKRLGPWHLGQRGWTHRVVRQRKTNTIRRQLFVESKKQQSTQKQKQTHRFREDAWQREGSRGHGRNG